MGEITATGTLFDRVATLEAKLTALQETASHLWAALSVAQARPQDADEPLDTRDSGRVRYGAGMIEF